METRSQRRMREEKDIQAAYSADTEDDMEMMWSPGNSPARVHPPYAPEGRGRGRINPEDCRNWNQLVAAHCSNETLPVLADDQLDGKEDRRGEEDKYESAEEEGGEEKSVSGT